MRPQAQAIRVMAGSEKYHDFEQGFCARRHGWGIFYVGQ